MSFDGSLSLAYAQAVIYAVFAIPTSYLIYKHGRPGLLGWIILLSFCMLRLIGNALQISAEKSHTSSLGAYIISSIGLSPLILGTLGVLHEARIYRNPNIVAGIEWPLTIAYHFLVGASLGILATGISRLLSPSSTSSPTTNSLLLEVGLALVLVTYVILVAVSIFSLHASQYSSSGQGYRAGTRLLVAVLIALPLIAVRVVYAAVSLLGQTGNVNVNMAVVGGLVGKVVLGTLPEMLVMALYMLVGLWTRNVRRERKGERHEIHVIRDKGSR